jgi:hypothetical protein
MNYYGSAQRFDDMEAWGQRLVALAEDERFADNQEIRLYEAKGSFTAMTYYGSAQRFDELEAWGQRLVALAEDERFADNQEIRLEEANGSVNAMAYYGRAQRFDELEAWGQRLVALAEDERFADNQEIRLGEAKGSYNAMTDYGRAQRFDELKAWGQRLVALAEDERFADNQEIRLEEANGSVNALLSYAKQGDDSHEEYCFWLNRLARVALEFPGNAIIQMWAKEFHVSWGDQRIAGLGDGQYVMRSPVGWISSEKKAVSLKESPSEEKGKKGGIKIQQTIPYGENWYGENNSTPQDNYSPYR